MYLNKVLYFFKCDQVIAFVENKIRPVSIRLNLYFCCNGFTIYSQFIPLGIGCSYSYIILKIVVIRAAKPRRIIPGTGISIMFCEKAYSLATTSYLKDRITRGWVLSNPVYQSCCILRTISTVTTIAWIFHENTSFSG